MPVNSKVDKLWFRYKWNIIQHVLNGTSNKEQK